MHPCHKRHPTPSLISLKILSSFFCDLQQSNWYFTVCYPFFDKAICFHSFGPCFPRFVFHQISTVVVACLSFAALLPHLGLKWKQRSYCSKIQSSFCFLPCRTSMDSRKVYILSAYSTNDNFQGTCACACTFTVSSMWKPNWLNYGSVRSQALDNCCIPSVPVRIARAPLENGVKEDCSYSYDLETVAGLYLKKTKNSE